MKKNLIKKFTALLLAGLMAFSFTGCAGSKKTKENSNTSSANASVTNADGKIKVVCTTYPQYDWVRQIIGDRKDDYELTLLLDNGVDLHSYQPTTEDIVKVGSADLFIYVGGESDGWVEDVLKQKTNPNLKTVNLLESIGEAAKEEEIKEGMQAEEEEKKEGEGEEKVEYDEHVWLSLKNAAVLVNVISKELENVDPKNKEAIEKNAADYIKEIDQLDSKYEDVVKKASKKAVVFADRFPFRYLVDDYGLDYYAAFVGCSAESEASFETVAFLSKKVDELGLKRVLVIESSDEKIANSVISSTKDKDMKILKMDSLQSITKDELNGEKSYLGVMTSNLSVLEEALN